MTTQIAVRLPDELVEFVDRLIRDGRATSRADAVARALERERRRELGRLDLERLAAAGPDPELDAFIEHAAESAQPDLD
jgi:Arc/MetJ-type ribon-helix-helix transcriptional regulator